MKEFSRLEALPPSPMPWDVRLGLTLGDAQNLVCLAGNSAAGPRGRFGIVGVPRSVATLESRPGATRETIARRSGDALYIALLGYELGYADLGLPTVEAPRGQPPGLVFELETFVLVDHQTSEAHYLGKPGPHLEMLRAASRLEPPPLRHDHLTFTSVVDDATHAARIIEAQEHIAAGDIYQANVTRRLRAVGEIHGAHAFAALMRRNPVAHGAYLRWPGGELISNSMETLLTFDATTRRAESFPIKGTAARGADSRSDATQARALDLDPKERAEHVMIVDLVRNDLGRLAVPGSVSVPHLFDVEPFRGVWHGVSTVRATIRPQFDAADVIGTLFPGGSITGAPKRRAMQLLHEMEGEARGFYTGSLAVITPSGDTSASILIRTLVRDDDGWSLNVGGGIVEASRPDREIQETWEKVDVFVKTFA